MQNALISLRQEMYHALTAQILPFWMNHALDVANGGFVGRIKQNGTVVADAEKGVVLNARILWTFSAAKRVLGDEAYQTMAARAYRYLWDYFHDKTHDGFYWSVAATGQPPLQSKKQTYAQAFVLYGLSEYYRATKQPHVLQEAIQVFRLIERHGRDSKEGGYWEALSADWQPLNEVRLSDKDQNAPKSMNTLLHVLEAYTNLYRVWQDPVLAQALTELIHVFLQYVVHPNGHLNLFFSEDWMPTAADVSFGHDIEAAWLLCEAAEVLENQSLMQTTQQLACKIAALTYAEGRAVHGGLWYERFADGRIDTAQHWWVQAEAIVGYLNAYQLSQLPLFAEAALETWQFIRHYLIDPKTGEWYWSVDEKGQPNRVEDLVGLWKCPYHNSRACLEVLQRIPAFVMGDGLPLETNFYLS